MRPDEGALLGFQVEYSVPKMLLPLVPFNHEESFGTLTERVRGFALRCDK
jgi:hypothetical protein